MVKNAAAVKRPRLSNSVVKELQGQIRSGELPLGAQLPTEQQLIRRFGVSRTVVREAISGLRANGMVEARQGSGVFVVGKRSMIDLGMISDDNASLASVLDLLELRIPIEVEAAGLAAQRRTSGQEGSIRTAFERLYDVIARGESSVSADFELHISIVEATQNQHFIDVLTFLGHKTIPRGQFASATAADPGAYLEHIQEEHLRIVDAITEQNLTLAREEMHRHLMGSYARYRALTTKVYPAHDQH